MTQGSTGFGVLLRRGNDASPQAFATIGEVKNTNGPNLKRDTVDATHSQSTNRFREVLSGLRDGGEVTCEVALVASGSASDAQAKLVADFKNDSLVDYQITFPNSAKTYWLFSGFLIDMSQAMPIDGEMMINLTFKVSGEPTLLDGWT